MASRPKHALVWAAISLLVGAAVASFSALSFLAASAIAGLALIIFFAAALLSRRRMRSRVPIALVYIFAFANELIDLLSP